MYKCVCHRCLLTTVGDYTQAALEALSEGIALAGTAYADEQSAIKKVSTSYMYMRTRTNSADCCMYSCRLRLICRCSSTRVASRAKAVDEAAASALANVNAKWDKKAQQQLKQQSARRGAELDAQKKKFECAQKRAAALMDKVAQARRAATGPRMRTVNRRLRPQRCVAGGRRELLVLCPGVPHAPLVSGTRCVPRLSLAGESRAGSLRRQR